MKIKRIELIENSEETRSRFIVYRINANKYIEVVTEFYMLETATGYAIDNELFVAVLMPLYKPVKDKSEGDE